MDTVDKICNEEIKFDSYNLSPSANNFLKKALQKVADHRITPREALSSPFILKNLSHKNLIKHQKSHYEKHNNHHHENEAQNNHGAETSDEEVEE